MENKPASFWSKPEGKFGMLALAAGAVGLVFAAPIILGWLTTMSGIVSTLIGLSFKLAFLGVVGFGLFLVWMIVTDPSVQNLASFFFKLIMKKVTGAIIEIDPIGIMKIYSDKLREGLERMYNSRNKLTGQIVIIQRTIDSQSKSIESSLKKASLAREQGNQLVMSVEAKDAERNRISNEERLKPALQKMQVLKAALDKIYTIAESTITDIDREIAHQERERKVIFAAYSAMTEARSIIKGNSSARQMYEDALAFTQEDYGNKFAEIQQFMNDSHSMIESFDFNNGVIEMDALAKLDDWEKKSEKILLGNSIKADVITFNPVGQKQAVPVGKIDYSNL